MPELSIEPGLWPREEILTNQQLNHKKNKNKVYIRGTLFQDLVAQYVRNFGKESPLILFVFKLPYQLEKGHFLGLEIFAWGGVRIDSFKGTYKITIELWNYWKILKMLK